MGAICSTMGTFYYGWTSTVYDYNIDVSLLASGTKYGLGNNLAL